MIKGDWEGFITTQELEKIVNKVFMVEDEEEE